MYAVGQVRIRALIAVGEKEESKSINCVMMQMNCISGIAAAKELSEYDPVVFEATESLGGVWRHCSYRSTKLQTPRCDYEFSDYPWPQRDNSSFPSHLEILDYLYSYANFFDLLKLVRFNSKVVQIRFVGDRETNDLGEYGSLLTGGKPVWEVAVQTNHSVDETLQVLLTITYINSIIIMLYMY